MLDVEKTAGQRKREIQQQDDHQLEFPSESKKSFP